MILVDTSVWIDHLTRRSVDLARFLEQGEVMTHPFVVGELACGNLKNRRNVLDLLNALPRALVATHEETLLLIEQRALMGKGISYVDAHLLASTALTSDARLWTADKRLREAAVNLRLAYDRP